MADGNEMPMQVQMPTSTVEGLIHIAGRLGSLEQALRGNVTHEKLTIILNEHRRELSGNVRDLETHIRGMLDSHTANHDKRQSEIQQASDRRVSDLFESLDRMLGEKVGGAVRDSMKARDEANEKARKEIDDKAKDAARGVRIFASSLPPLIAGVFVAAGFVAWMWFTGKL